VSEAAQLTSTSCGFSTCIELARSNLAIILLTSLKIAVRENESKKLYLSLNCKCLNGSYKNHRMNKNCFADS